MTAPGFEQGKISQEPPPRGGQADRGRSKGMLGWRSQRATVSASLPTPPPPPAREPASPPLPLPHNVTSWFSQEAAVPIKHPSPPRPRAGHRPDLA